jgi:hypothetical protein
VNDRTSYGEDRKAGNAGGRGSVHLRALIDPRQGDIEDDASSTKQHSMLRLAGSLLAEVSLPKLFTAWVLLILLPGLVFGLAPLAVSIWLSTLTRSMSADVGWVISTVLLLAIVATGLLAGHRLLRIAEGAFWSLNSLAIQPAYALVREGIRHLAVVARGDERRARLERAAALSAGVIVCALSIAVAALVWPSTRWFGVLADLATPSPLLLAGLANAVFAIGVYVAVVAPIWGIADAAMGAPRDLIRFDGNAEGERLWRVAHLSDLHIVGERYGFRIESGRAGPHGNERVQRLLDKLDAIDSERPLDLILITGDATDAGRSSEWGEFLESLAQHPRLAGRALLLPGNHDLNVVDRANPARLELPTSPGKRLRQMRTLSAIAAVQGDRVRVVDARARQLGQTIFGALASESGSIARFADQGTRRLARHLERVWLDAFPMVLPPDGPDGLGVILLNSIAETHFSFTNALGLITTEQARKLRVVVELYPKARWIVALHHHLVEYPKPAKSFSERVGTALINGSWFVRQLRPFAERVVAVHGHRHVDWVGECSGVRIVSAPSPVMEATNDEPTHFYILRLASGAGGGLRLLPPERVDLAGEAGPT